MSEKPRLLVLQSRKVNFDLPTYVESDVVREHFDVTKSHKIKGNPDLIYTQAYAPFYREIMGCSVPVVMHFGGSPWLEFVGDRLSRVVSMARKARLVVCNSRFLEGVFRDNLGTSNIMHLPDGLWGLDHTPIGPMPGRFGHKYDYSVRNDEFLVVMSIIMADNRIKRNKWRGVPIFLEAVKDIAKEHRVRFLCVGRGSEDFPHLDRWREEYNYHFLPSHHLDEGVDRWPEILRSADMFVHPGTFDCWPRVVADAALTGLPGIVFDATGNAEVSEAYPAVEPDDVVGIRREFMNLLESETQREVNGARALQDALQRTREHRGDYARILLEVLK